MTEPTPMTKEEWTELADIFSAKDFDGREGPERTRRLLATIQSQDDELAKKDALIERLKQETIIHAGEAKTQTSTVREINQVVSGATGEKATWNGSRPVKEAIEERDATIQSLSDRVEELEKETVTLDGFDYDFTEWVYEFSEGNIKFGSPLENSSFIKFSRWHLVQQMFADNDCIYPDEAEYFASLKWLENAPVTQTQIDNEEAREGAKVGDDYWHTTTLGYSMQVIGENALWSKFKSAALKKETP